MSVSSQKWLKISCVRICYVYFDKTQFLNNKLRWLFLFSKDFDYTWFPHIKEKNRKIWLIVNNLKKTSKVFLLDVHSIILISFKQMYKPVKIIVFWIIIIIIIENFIDKMFIFVQICTETRTYVHVFVQRKLLSLNKKIINNIWVCVCMHENNPINIMLGWNCLEHLEKDI